MVRSLCALAFVLAAVTVQADNCAGIGAAWKMSSSDTQLCTTADTSCTKDSCPCKTNCCVVKAGTCQALSGSMTCDAATSVSDESKVSYTETGWEVAATQPTQTVFQAKCCKKKETCDKYTCLGDYKAKPKTTVAPLFDPATAYCYGAKCAIRDMMTCCEATPLTCSAGFYSVGCSGGKTGDQAKSTVTYTDDADFQTKCCKTRATTIDPKCDASVICSGVFVDAAAKATIMCMSTRNGVCVQPSVAARKSTVCCTTKAGTCYVAAGTGSVCDAAEFADPAKNAVEATATDFKTKCCTKKATCKAFAAVAKAGSTSATIAQ